MKAAYAACDISKTKANFAEKLIRVYMPSGHTIGRLVKRQKGSARCVVEVYRGSKKLRISFSNHSTSPDSATINGAREWMAEPIESVYIPVKEMLANAPGFRSLYAQREIHFEEIYADILDRAYRPALRGPMDGVRKKLLKNLQSIIEGKVTITEEEFFLRNKQGNLEFTLLAEGMRKLGLLWLLIQNGTLLNGSVLFWDEPEAKELDLRKKAEDNVSFHSLYREDETGEIRCHTTGEFLHIHPNAIADVFSSLYDREIKRSLGEILK